MFLTIAEIEILSPGLILVLDSEAVKNSCFSSEGLDESVTVTLSLAEIFEPSVDLTVITALPFLNPETKPFWSTFAT